MYQKITLVGNLGRDPEMRYTPNGLAITQMNIATSNKRKDADGSLKDETTWWRVSAFGKQAETCNQYLAKGSRILVEGELVGDPTTGGPRVYTRKDGTTGASFEVRANNIKFLSNKQSGPSDASGDGVTEIASGSPSGVQVSDLDLPF